MQNPNYFDESSLKIVFITQTGMHWTQRYVSLSTLQIPALIIKILALNTELIWLEHVATCHLT